MSEEIESSQEGGGGIDPVALAAAMGRASSAVDAELTSYLSDQRHHLHVQLKSLHLSIWEKRLGVLLRIATAFVGVAVACGVGFLIWNASQSSDLVMDSFSVPPDLVAKGLSGEAMAGDIAGRVTDMLGRFPNSARAPQSYGNSFGEGIKIEIPETGVSLSELDRFLRQKLGSDTQITGTVVRTAKGLKLTVRAGALGGVSVEGPESDLDSLQQQLAEALFGITQPYRYGAYLLNSNKWAEANAVFLKLTNAPSAREQAWAYAGLGIVAGGPTGGGSRAARDFGARAVEIDPSNYLATANFSGAESSLGHDEQNLVLSRKALELLSRPDHGQIRPDRIEQYRLSSESTIAEALGAYQESTQKLAAAYLIGRRNAQGQSAQIARPQRLAHDLTAARATMVSPIEDTPGRALAGAFANERERMLIDMSAEDWDSALKHQSILQDFLTKIPSARLANHLDHDPYVAQMLAKLGRFDEAEKLVADMPGDCTPCVIARGQIAALQKQNARADWWFDRAVKAAPSIPFAYYEWGKALKERGDFTGAIAQFKLANQKGPHFADPLEMWGEVLMARNRSDLAIAKFTEAEKYAPNWGRLHLKWGEALLWTGKPVDAEKQFARAGELDLTAAEKTELAKVRR